LKAGIYENGIIVYPTKGTPQGGPISPLLCNMTLNGSEEVVRPGRPKYPTKAYRDLKGIWPVRYADDIVITSPTKPLICEKFIPKLKAFLKVRGLEISQSKLKIVDLKQEPLEFLG
jgi:RNA-directed DNA polymerase